MKFSNISTELAETLWLFGAFIFVGLVNGVLGPTILGLQSLVSFTMDLTTYILLIQGTGFMLGVVVAFLLEKKFNIRLIMIVSLITGSLSSGALPWVKNYLYVATMFFLQSLAKGSVDYTCLAICNELWSDNKGVAFQFVTLGAAIGAFVIPFIARPFLATQIVTSPANVNCSHPVLLDTTLTNSNKDACIIPGHIEYPYLIIAFLCIPPIIAFIYYFIKRHTLPLMTNNYEKVQLMTSEPRKTSSLLYPLLIGIMFLLHLPVMSMPLAYGDLLTSYGVHSKWHFSRRRMATMTSVFWGGLLIGRIANLAMTKYVAQFYVLCINFGGLFMTSIVLCTWTTDYEIALWVGSAALGFFSSSLLPMVLTWVSEYACLTGSMIFVCLFSAGLGEMLVPFVSGWVFGNGGTQSLMYLVAGFVSFEIIMFIALVLVARQYNKHRAGIMKEVSEDG